MKELLQEGDILVFKSGTERKYTHLDKWMIDNFYDDNLVCRTNAKFTVVEVLRPTYEVVFKRDVNKRIR